MTINVIYARKWPLTTILKGERRSCFTSPTLFLAGPTTRNQEACPSWRSDALLFLERTTRNLTVFVPEDENWGLAEGNYVEQVLWEWEALDTADAILFWIPRDLDTLPGFTTNVEFGMYYNSGKVVAGWPEKTPKTGYLKMLADRAGVEHRSTLEVALSAAVALARDRFESSLIKQS